MANTENNLASRILGAGVDASKPTAAAWNANFFWFSTDIAGGTLYRSTGSAWVQMAPGVSQAGGAGMTNPMTTKGDLIVGGASGTPNRFGVVADGYSLIADSTQTLGVKWAPHGLGSLVGCAAHIAAATTIANNTDVQVGFDTNDWDEGAPTSQQFHYTSGVALTGTVAKTSGSTTLTGTGTLFTSELSVNQVIDVPGTSTERKVITTIASDTSLTVATAFSNTASGQTATRTNQAVAIPSGKAGKYLITFGTTYPANGTGTRDNEVFINGSLIIQGDAPSNGNINNAVTAIAVRALSAYDLVEFKTRQNSGGSLTPFGWSATLTLLGT